MAPPQHLFNPRNPRTANRHFKKLPSFTHLFLPLSVLFVLGGSGYALYWSNERKKNPCIDCQRQKEIAEEIYFGKKAKGQNSGSRI